MYLVVSEFKLLALKNQVSIDLAEVVQHELQLSSNTIEFTRCVDSLAMAGLGVTRMACHA